MEQLTKQCSSCLITKPIKDFGKNKLSKSGVQYYCKSCGQNYSKNFRKKHTNKKKTDTKNWYIKNPNYNKQYYICNKEKCQLANKVWRKNNRKLRRFLYVYFKQCNGKFGWRR